MQNLFLTAALNANKLLVHRHLGVSTAVLHQRIERAAANLAEVLQVEVTKAVEHLGDLSVRELGLLLAEGPAEQTRALLLPEQVHPHAHQGLSGHGEPAEDVQPVSDASEAAPPEDNPANAD